MPEPSERLWKDLLLYIKAGRVIPVVGPELVTVLLDGAEVPLSHWLARRLAQEHGLPLAGLPDGFDLNQLVQRHFRRKTERNKLCTQIDELLAEAQLAPDCPLLALAEISGLDLFVSLTFDGLLAAAIARARPGAAPLQVAYAHNAESTAGDLPAPRKDLGRPLVFNLLGRASPVPDFALCEDDLLEFVRALQDKQRQPKKLLDALKESHLLILGCGYGDWLARFFLRTLRDVEFWQFRNSSDYLVGGAAGSDPDLRRFLHDFSEESVAVDMQAGRFLQELARRWRLDQEKAAAAVPSGSAQSAPPFPAGPSASGEDGKVFVSFASEDFAAAQSLAAGLAAAGLDVWFEREQLGPGADLPTRIELGIQRCAVFVPVISARSLNPDIQESWYWREWNAADYRARGFAPDAAFIVPVVVDGTSPDLSATQLHESFKRKLGAVLPGGMVTQAFTDSLTDLVQAYHRSRRSRHEQRRTADSAAA